MFCQYEILNFLFAYINIKINVTNRADFVFSNRLRNAMLTRYLYILRGGINNTHIKDLLQDMLHQIPRQALCLHSNPHIEIST